MTNIRKGTKLLDTQYPGWEEAIDLDSLDLASVQSCVLGQLAQWLNLEAGFAEEELGFDVSELGELGFTTSDASYPELTSKWKRAIKRRLRKKEITNVT